MDEPIPRALCWIRPLNGLQPNLLSTWNPKQPFINGCFNWMIPNLYIGNGCFTKHLFINGCLEFQVVTKFHNVPCPSYYPRRAYPFGSPKNPSNDSGIPSGEHTPLASPKTLQMIQEFRLINCCLGDWGINSRAM